MKRGLIDLVGQTFGWLTVVERGTNGKHSNVRWRCLCECGRETLSTSRNLRRGGARSCGCKRGALVSASNTTHAGSKRPEYLTWLAMKSRCGRATDPAFHNYGARGIRVCERWRSFAAFFADMGPRPAGGTLERVDNDGPYSPENCRWASRAEQAANTRRNRKFSFRGADRTIAEIARLTGISEHTLHYRLVRSPKKRSLEDWGVV